MLCNAVHLSPLSETRSQAIKLLTSPCGDTTTDKKEFTSFHTVLCSVWSHLSLVNLDKGAQSHSTLGGETQFGTRHCIQVEPHTNPAADPSIHILENSENCSLSNVTSPNVVFYLNNSPNKCFVLMSKNNFKSLIIHHNSSKYIFLVCLHNKQRLNAVT